MASLEYHEKNPPFGVLACAELGGLGSGIEKVPRSDINVKQPPKMVVKAENVRFEGVATCLRFFAMSGSAKFKLFMDASPVEATQIDQWIDWSGAWLPLARASQPARSGCWRRSCRWGARTRAASRARR